MHIRTITSVATLLAVTAVGFAGCAAEETTDSPTGNAANGNGGQVTATTSPNTANVNSAGATTTVNSAAANTAAGNTTGAGTTGGAAGPTTTGAAVTNTVAGAAAVTTGTPAAAANTVAGAANNTTGGGASCDAPAAMGTAPIIDDFEDDDHTIADNEGRLGYWYEYGDADGTQTTTPLDGAPGSGGVLHSTGSGFTEYVGFGVDLNNDNANQEPCEYDASFHTGIQFDITNDTDVTFQVALPGTTDSSDHYGIAVPAGTNVAFKAPFASLMQGGWGDEAAWDPSKILQLQWQVTDPTAAFDITLDNVTFY